MKPLSVICVNWNSVDYARECLKSLYANTMDLEFEVIVVDNASPDGQATLLEREFPQVTLVRSDRNLGFAGANNLGYEKSSGECLLFLNPDTIVIDRAIVTMLEHLSSLPHAGIVGCRLLNSDFSIQTSCIQRFPTILNQVLDIEWLRQHSRKWRFWGMAPLFSEHEAATEVEVISGACLMIKRDVFKKVGLFSREYFMYADDVDLCYKIRKWGLTSYYVGSASIVHHGGGASRQRKTSHWAAIMQRNAILTFYQKTRGHVYALTYRTAVGLIALVRLILIAFVYPIRKMTGGGDNLFLAFGKWAAIFRWAIGCARGIVQMTAAAE